MERIEQQDIEDQDADIGDHQLGKGERRGLGKLLFPLPRGEDLPFLPEDAEDRQEHHRSDEERERPH